MSGFKVQVKPVQLDELRRNLDELERNLRTRALQAGLRRGINPITRDMKRNAPRRTGRLQQSIGQRALSRTAKGRLGIPADDAAVLAGPVRKVGGYAQDYKAYILEKGVPAGTREVRRNLRGHVRYRRDGQWTAYSYYHPGMRAQPFMEPALARNESQFVGRFYDGLLAYLERRGLKL